MRRTGAEQATSAVRGEKEAERNFVSVRNVTILPQVLRALKDRPKDCLKLAMVAIPWSDGMTMADIVSPEKMARDDRTAGYGNQPGYRNTEKFWAYMFHLQGPIYL